MKVLGIVCSPRLHGNTEILVQESLAGAEEAGADVELLTLAEKNVTPCDSCRTCLETKKCRIKDDMQDIYPKLLEADGIIFGTPVYFRTVSAQVKALIDRTLALYGGPEIGAERRLRNKVGGVVVTTARSGGASAIAAFTGFFSLQRMIMVGGVVGFGGTLKGKIRDDKSGMEEARLLGKAIVRHIQSSNPKLSDLAVAHEERF